MPLKPASEPSAVSETLRVVLMPARLNVFAPLRPSIVPERLTPLPMLKVSLPLPPMKVSNAAPLCVMEFVPSVMLKFALLMLNVKFVVTAEKSSVSSPSCR